MGVAIWSNLVFGAGVGILIECLVFTWESSKRLHFYPDEIKQDDKLTLSSRYYNATGPFFFANCPGFHKKINPAKEADHVILDLEHVRVVDISALLSLEELCTRLHAEGKRLHVVNTDTKFEHFVHELKASVPYLNDALKYDLLQAQDTYQVGYDHTKTPPPISFVYELILDHCTCGERNNDSDAAAATAASTDERGTVSKCLHCVPDQLRNSRELRKQAWDDALRIGTVIRHKEWDINVTQWRHYSKYSASTPDVATEDQGSSEEIAGDGVESIVVISGSDDEDFVINDNGKTFVFDMDALRKKDREKIRRLVGKKGVKMEKVTQLRKRVKKEHTAKIKAKNAQKSDQI